MPNKKANIDDLTRENNELRRENNDLKRILSSKRFRIANKIGNTFNSFFPIGTKRRQAIKTAMRGATKINSAKQKRILRPLINTITAMSSNKKNVMIINSIPWNVELKQRPHHLAIEFSKLGYFVVFLECTNKINHFRKINDSFITTNDPKLLDAFKGTEKNIYFMQLSTIPSISIDEIMRLKKVINMQVIYDYIDEIHEDISGDLYHQKLIWNSLDRIDPILITVTADRLFKQIRNHYDKTKILISKNAVDVAHFNPHSSMNTSSPRDMKQILNTGQPVVGYYGAIAPWLDYELLNKLAKKRQDLQFVYIGLDYGDALKELKQFPNVHYLGPKEYDDLPKYSHCFNCAIIPFVTGEIAKATSPVKLFEYMAAGLPTICTKDLEECKGYDYIYISKNNTEFEKNIDKAIHVVRKQYFTTYFYSDNFFNH